MEYQKELEELDSIKHKKAVESLIFKEKQDSLFSTIIIRSQVRDQLAAFSVGKTYDEKILELLQFYNDRKEVNK
jgi:hypothetical protein